MYLHGVQIQIQIIIPLKTSVYSVCNHGNWFINLCTVIDITINNNFLQCLLLYLISIQFNTYKL